MATSRLQLNLDNIDTLDSIKLTRLAADGQVHYTQGNPWSGYVDYKKFVSTSDISHWARLNPSGQIMLYTRFDNHKSKQSLIQPEGLFRHDKSLTAPVGTFSSRYTIDYNSLTLLGKKDTVIKDVTQFIPSRAEYLAHSQLSYDFDPEFYRLYRGLCDCLLASPDQPLWTDIEGSGILDQGIHHEISILGGGPASSDPKLKGNPVSFTFIPAVTKARVLMTVYMPETGTKVCFINQRVGFPRVPSFYVSRSGATTLLRSEIPLGAVCMIPNPAQSQFHTV